MKLNEFIFSKNKNIRISRHAVAWISLWIISVVLYPPKGAGSANGLGADGFFAFYRMVLIRTFLMLLSQMLFAYLFLYILIPVYLLKKKYVRFVILISVIWTITAAFRYAVYVYIYNPLMVYFHYNINDPKFILILSFRQTISGPAFMGGLFISFKLFKDWQQKQKDNFDLQKENISAEVQLLKAQIHPHFLFNTLNNIYSYAINHSPKAADLVQELYNMMHYMVNECDDPYVSLHNEIKILESFTELERVRYGKRLNLEWNISGNHDDKAIAPLLMIPFLENSFKHGTSQTLKNPWIKLKINTTESRLFFTLSNGKPSEADAHPVKKGIGLANVKKRLQLIYGSTHLLKLQENAEEFSVYLEIPVRPLPTPEP